MRRQNNIILGAILITLIGSATMAAELRFNQHYSSNMVLQREKPVLIRGFAKKGADVTVIVRSLVP